MKRAFSLLLALMVVFSMAMPAYAAGGSMTIHGKNNITCRPGVYTATDLFDDGFKNVMPGDTITGYVSIRGDFRSFHEDTLKVWMRALVHSEDGNDPKHPANTDVKSMNDFLSQLTLRVYNESKKGVKIFEGKANELDGLRENVYLGSFRKNGEILLRVELVVPIELGNEFADSIGEVDWVFTVEAFDDPSYDNPKTGDYIMIAIAVMAVSATALVILWIVKRRKK